jgi:hypothetical protein
MIDGWRFAKRTQREQPAASPDDTSDAPSVLGAALDLRLTEAGLRRRQRVLPGRESALSTTRSPTTASCGSSPTVSSTHSRPATCPLLNPEVLRERSNRGARTSFGGRTADPPAVIARFMPISRSGDRRPAPQRLGDRRYMIVEAAPGEYELET